MSYIGQGLPADTFQGFTTDKFTGDGTANKAFTLTKEPFSEDTILVTIDGVVQEPTDDFTVSGTTLTLVGTAANNSEINVTHMGGPLPIGEANKLDLNGASDQLILDADGDTTISADTDDQIDIKIGGADDFAFKANNFEVQSGSTIDMNGQELILDADADTSITADTDDKIEFKCGGLDTININKFGQVVHTRDSATTFGGSTSFIHQRGTIASPSVVNSGDTIGMIQTTAYDGTAYLDGARILFQVDGTPGDDDMPTRIVFQTTADGSAGTLSERMRINNTGHVQITGDGASGGGANDYTLALDNQDTSSPNGIYNKYTGAAPDSGSNYFMVNQDSSTNRCIIFNTGNLGNHDNSYGAISDERIKQDITDVNSQWDDIKNLKVRNFKMKDDIRDYGDKAEKRIGLIAQETETVSPGLIQLANPSSGDIKSDASFGTLYTSDDEETKGDNPTAKVGDVKEIKEQVKHIKYSILYMKAIKALQEAMAKIETLETKVKALEDA